VRGAAGAPLRGLGHRRDTGHAADPPLSHTVGRAVPAACTDHADMVPQRRAVVAERQHDGPLRAENGMGARRVSDDADAHDGDTCALIVARGVPCRPTDRGAVRIQVGEDAAALNAEWQAAIATGPGGMLNISKGLSRDARRAIVMCQHEAGCTLPTNSSKFNFVITHLDPELVHARLTFSHTYDHPGVYTAYFEGCCRSRRLYNNAGLSFHLRTSVDVLSVGSAPRPAVRNC
jgi:hypothetical protein